jgi:hypothetical protein
MKRMKTLIGRKIKLRRKRIRRKKKKDKLRVYLIWRIGRVDL